MDPAALKALEALAESSSLGEESRLFRGMFYGDPGAGKTTLAAQIAMLLGKKAMFVTTDSSWSVLYKYPQWKDRIHRFPFSGYSMLSSIIDAIDKDLTPYSECDTLVWDTSSGGAAKYMRTLVKSKALPPQFTKQQIDKEQPVWPHYGIAANALEDLITKLSESKLHIIYTAHVRIPNDQDTTAKKFAIRPDLPEASFKVLHREVNLLGFVHREKKGSDRLVQLDGTLTETAKSQIVGIEEKTYRADELPELVRKWVKND